MNTVKKALSVWCDKAWLAAVYALGLAALAVLVFNWGNLSAAERIAWALAVGIPMHVFEENTWPGGFFYMNNLSFGSQEPLVYPQNRATNMVTNLGAEIVFVLIAVRADALGATAVTVAVFFGFVELLNHTREGIGMHRRFKDKGKRTIYAPGEATSLLVLAPLSVFGIVWLANNAFEWTQVLAGLGICLGVAVLLIIVPFAFNLRVKSKTFAFKDAGYFEKYLG